jgi:hypothetical protein
VTFFEAWSAKNSIVVRTNEQSLSFSFMCAVIDAGFDISRMVIVPFFASNEGRMMLVRPSQRIERRVRECSLSHPAYSAPSPFSVLIGSIGSGHSTRLRRSLA